MEVPMFSQVPREILNRIRPIGEPRKRIRFCEPERSPEPIQEEIVVVEDVSSSFSDHDSPPRQVSLRPTSPGSASPILAKERKTTDAIIQVQPPMVSRKTQTDESYFKTYEASIRKLQQSSLMLSPMYNTIQSKGDQPPLKIGLTGLPRKKRKVFYPDQENDDDE